MKNTFLLFCITFFISIVGFSQTLIPNKPSFLISTQGSMPPVPGDFFDGDINTPPLLCPGLYVGPNGYIGSGGANPNPWPDYFPWPDAQHPFASVLVIDLEKIRYISSITFQNIIGAYYYANGTLYQEGFMTFNIQTRNNPISEWEIAKTDTTITQLPYFDIENPNYSQDRNIPIKKAARYWKFTVTNATPPNFSCANGNSGDIKTYAIKFSEFQFFEKPLITTNGSTLLQNGSSVILKATTGGEDYLWSNGATSQSITVSNSGVYTVTVTNTSFSGNQSHTASISVSTVGVQDNLWGPNGEIFALYKNGNNIYFGGDFNYVGPITGSGAQINKTTGIHDPDLPRVDGTIYCIKPDGFGGWYIGGLFARVGNCEIKNLTHIKFDKTVDNTFMPQPNGAVNTMQISGPKIYIGGNFTTIQGMSSKYLAKIDKITGEPELWDAQADGEVYSLQLYNNLIIVGGNYTTIGGAARNYLASMDTIYVQATPWIPDPNALVRKVNVTGSELYIGGDFTTINGSSKKYLAGFTLPGFTIKGWNAGANGSVYDIYPIGTTLYTAGNFTIIGQEARNYIAAINTSSGLATLFNPNADNIVFSLAWDGTNLFAGGNFTSIGGLSRNKLACLNISNGTATTWNPDVHPLKGGDALVYTLALSNSNIYAGGNFYSMGGVLRNNIASIDATTGIATLWDPNANNIIRTILVDNNYVYIGGDFTTINNSIIKNRIAQFTIGNSSPTGWNPNADNSVYALAIKNNILYVGGSFENIGGAARSKMAALGNSGAVTTFNPAPNGNINTFCIGGDTLFIGGAFTTIGGVTRNRIAAYNLNNNTITGINPNADNTINTLALNNKKLYIGGTFNAISGIPRVNFAGYDIINSSVITMNPNFENANGINAVFSKDSAIYQGGEYRFPNCGNPITNLSAIKINQNSLGYWQPQPDDLVRTLFVTNDKVYIGGRFKNILSRYQPYFASSDIYLTAKPNIISLSTTNACVNSSLTVIGEGFIGVTSTKIGGVNVPFTIISANSIILTPNSVLSGTITITNGLGTATSTQTVNVNAIPTATISPASSTTFCQGGNVVLNANTGSDLTYQWTLNGSNITLETNASYTATASGDYAVIVTKSSCATTSSATTVTVNPFPVAAGTISGNTTVCQGQNPVVYTVPAITNASSYIWTLPAGATGTSTTNSITLNYGTTAISGNITVKGNNSCGDGANSTLAITVNPLPVSAGTISGNATVCQGQNSVTYTVPAITNATSYVWTLPTGAIGTSSINSITLNYGTSAVSGNISVKGTNSCGDGATSSLAIIVNPLPVSAGIISGNTTVCQGQNAVTYTVPAITNATSYVWTLPTGATGTSTTNSITLNYGTTAITGNITVKGNNSCGDGANSTLAITVNPLPVSAGTISGTTTVCQGQNSVTYTVPSITNATSYVWTLPTGANGTSTSNSITLNYGTSAVSGDIAVKGTNSCGDGASSTIAITVNPLPLAAGTISGITTVCQGENSVTYSIPAITNATSYIWTLPIGANGTSTTNSITLNYSTSAVSGNITVKGNNTCGDGVISTLAVTVNPLPLIAGSISGSTSVCQGQNSVTYTVPSITNATSYVWTLPGDASGTSTTNSITVNFGTSAVSGNITVKGANSCGEGATSTLAITVNPLVLNAGTISGSTSVCQGQNSVSYTVPAITNATSYIWMLPTGAIGSSTTNSITLNYGTYAVSGDITVKGTNSCGDGASSTLAIVVNPLPLAAGTISGSTTVCQGQNSVTYTVPSITNATSYIWTLLTGATGTSTTNSITVNYGTSAVSGNITVKGNNSCGDGSISTLAITVNAFPSTAGTITGSTIVCQGQNSITYSVPTITNATSYIWTLPSGATGTSTSNSITVNFGTSAITDNITVKGQNSCGDGATSTLTITVNPLPVSAGTISGTTIVCQGQNAITYTVPIITNSTSYIWTLPTGASGTSTTNSISVNYGTSAISGNITVKGNNSCGEGVISTLSVTVNPLPLNAGTISGSTTVCQGQNQVTYSVPTITNATSYVWALPTGATGTSTTNSITLSYGTSAVSDDITVKGINACGDGGTSTLAIIVNLLPVSAEAISGNTTVCQGQSSVTYTVPTITNATSYVWVLPTGASGTSTTNSISVNYGTSAVSGNISVKGNNSCGDGNESLLSITVTNKPITPIITLNGYILHSDAAFGNQWYNQNGLLNGETNQEYNVTATGDYHVIVTLDGCSSNPSNILHVVYIGIGTNNNNSSIKIYPNPVSNELIIENEGNTKKTHFEILNTTGQIVFKGNLIEKTVIQTASFTEGVYLIKLSNGETFEFRKIVKE